MFSTRAHTFLRGDGAFVIALSNAEHEIEKARKLLKRKQDVSAEKQKAYLARHGFEIETMGKVIDEKQ